MLLSFFQTAHCINENDESLQQQQQHKDEKDDDQGREVGGAGEEEARAKQEERNKKEREKKQSPDVRNSFLHPLEPTSEEAARFIPRFSLSRLHLLVLSRKPLQHLAMVRFVDRDAEERRRGGRRDAKPLSILFERMLSSSLLPLTSLSLLSRNQSQADARVLQHVLETNKPCQAQVRRGQKR